MPTNRVTGNARDGIVVLRTERDREYDLVQIAERFEVPYVEFQKLTPWQKLVYVASVEKTAKEVGKKAIERYENLRHWRYYSSRPPELDLSQVQNDLDSFRSIDQKNLVVVDHGSLINTLGNKAYVLKLWFIVPKVEVQWETPEPDDPEVSDGMVNPYKMPAFYSLENK